MAPLFLTSALDGGEWSASSPGLLAPEKRVGRQSFISLTDIWLEILKEMCHLDYLGIDERIILK
jgi:hypothetical protein